MTSQRKRRREQRRQAAAPRARTVVPSAPAATQRALALVVFALALVLRLLFWRATEDRAWPYSVAFKGDAALWLEYAGALREGRPFELGLPIHPPGAAWLVA